MVQNIHIVHSLLSDDPKTRANFFQSTAGKLPKGVRLIISDLAKIDISTAMRICRTWCYFVCTGKAIKIKLVFEVESGT